MGVRDRRRQQQVSQSQPDAVKALREVEAVKDEEAWRTARAARVRTARARTAV